MKHLEITKSLESFCVFQIGDALFALGAAHLREVALRPKLASIPNSHVALGGLWHEGSEFIPVLRMPTQSSESDSSERHVMVVMGSQGAWGLLVDRVHGIEPLELSRNDADCVHDDWTMAQIGASRWNEQLVRILNADGLYRLIEEILKRTWAAR